MAHAVPAGRATRKSAVPRHRRVNAPLLLLPGCAEAEKTPIPTSPARAYTSSHHPTSVLPLWASATYKHCACTIPMQYTMYYLLVLARITTGEGRRARGSATSGIVPSCGRPFLHRCWPGGKSEQRTIPVGQRPPTPSDFALHGAQLVCACVASGPRDCALETTPNEPHGAWEREPGQRLAALSSLVHV